MEQQFGSLDRIMEPETISKNGASSKSHTSRENKITLRCLFLFCVAVFSLSGCKGSSYFVKGDGGRTTVQVADRISYNLAFDEVVTVLMRQFEIEMISKEAGYIRTTWKTTWVAKAGQKPQKDYRVRVTVRISEERKRVDIHAEAEKLKGNFWIGGYDTRLLEIIRRDIAGLVGY